MPRNVILLWDEEPISEKALINILEKSGFEVLTAKKERQCFQYLSNRRIDLVLLNINRSDLEGLMLIKRIKSRSKHKHTPVISIMDINNMIAQPMNISWGCDEYLTKPIDKNLLLERMEFLLDKYFY